MTPDYSHDYYSQPIDLLPFDLSDQRGGLLCHNRIAAGNFCMKYPFILNQDVESIAVE